MGIGISQEKGKQWLYVESDGKRQQQRAWSGKTVYLRVSIDSKENRHSFSVSHDGKRFEPVGEVFSLQMGSWKGSRVGLYCYNTGGDGGTAAFDFFDYDISR
jgi:beta-xylosidase